VPDQHAAFGIAKATRESREPGWRDLGLVELVSGGPAAVGRPQQQQSGAVRAVAGGTAATMQTAELVGGGLAGAVVQEGQRPGEAFVGPATGVVGVPVGVRAGLRGTTGSSTVGSDLRGWEGINR
jgi:hypothetical protein